MTCGNHLHPNVVCSFNEDMARFYFRQLVQGVGYCHSQGVCHRDLKPGTSASFGDVAAALRQLACLVCPCMCLFTCAHFSENLLLDEQSNLKISDFGLSALYGGESSDDRMTLLHTTCGTPNYVAPEVLSDKGYDGRAADVWSIGVILYVLLAGFLPFDEPHMSALFRKIQKADFTYPSWFTSEVRGLLDAILVPDPAKRLTLSGIMDHPWFNAGASEAGSAATGAAAGASGGLVPTPSQQQMDAAVSEGVDETAASAAAADEPAQPMTQYQVVAEFGGKALKSLLDPEASGPAARKHYVSKYTPVEIVERAAKVLTEMGITVETGDSKVTGSFFQNSGGEATEGAAPLPALGEVRFDILVHDISSGLHLVEVKKAKGDTLAFHQLYSKFAEELCTAVENVDPKAVAASAAAAGSA